MTIDKAIKILDEYERFGAECTHPDLPDAIRLGREALKRIRHGRNRHYYNWLPPLPGEEVEP